MAVHIRYFAAAAAAAGVATRDVEIDPAASMSQIADYLGENNDSLRHVLGRCSFLRDAEAVTDLNAPLGRCQVIDVLPPFAGG